jgi:hypothetical protein
MTAFDTVAAGFWDAGNDAGAGPPLTGELVAAAQRELGVTLPADLLRLLRLRNGGVVAAAWDAFAMPGRPDDWVAVDELFGIVPGGGLSLLDTAYLVREWGLPSPVVLLAGDGHTWVALDYRGCGPDRDPPVVWFDADEQREVLLAADFRAFVEGLTASAGWPG